MLHSPHTAYLWECTPIQTSNLDKQCFEFVITKNGELDRKTPNPDIFREHFNTKHSCIVFSGLGGDAMLVAPVLTKSDLQYQHLCSFMGSPSVEEKDALWKSVAVAMDKELGSTNSPRWLSTSGLGVSWLHVRIDSTPKYYSHQEYKKMGELYL